MSHQKRETVTDGAETYAVPTGIYEVWLHFDRRKKKSAAVWAVQYREPVASVWSSTRPVYAVATAVQILTTSGVTRTQRDGLQPSAWIRFPSAVVQWPYGRGRVAEIRGVEVDDATHA